MRRHRPYCPVSVATTFQFGSREETSRANVHTSVTSVTFSALPSITVPLRSRVAGHQLGNEAHGDLRRAFAQLGCRDGRAVDRNETRLDGLAAAFAFGDRGVETVEHLARQQVAQLPAIALGKGGDDHLIGGARAGDEMLGIEICVGRRDRIEPRRDRRAAFGDALPALARAPEPARRSWRGFRRARRQGHDLVGRRAAHRVARRIRVVGRPFAAGALAQDAAKPQENEYCERQKDDGVDVVSNTFDILSASQMAGRCVP